MGALPSPMPQETKTDRTPVAEAETSLHGWAVDMSDPQMALDALDKAFDYRGDVTLTLTDGAEVGGFIFDRIRGDSLADSTLRLMGPKSDTPVVVTYDTIATLTFSGKDAAHGKSFERWVAKYVEKKLAGQSASIESESLDED